MSMRVHGAIRFTSTDLGDILERLRALRPAVTALQTKIRARAMAQRITASLDAALVRARTGAIETEKLWEVYARETNAIEDEIRRAKRDGSRLPRYDVAAEICISPFEGAYYATFYVEEEAIAEVVRRALPQVDYSYWDNTDRPARISRAAWDERGRVWNEIFSSDPYRRPGACGFVFRYPADPCLPDIATVLRVQPSLDTRARDLAANLLAGEHLEEKRAEFGQDPSLSDVMEIMYELRAGDRREEVSRRAVELRDVLPRRYRPKDVARPATRLAGAKRKRAVR